ncbi:hypothetical protein GCM10027395_14860 [Giesbergeria sinuosa]
MRVLPAGIGLKLKVSDFCGPVPMPTPKTAAPACPQAVLAEQAQPEGAQPHQAAYYCTQVLA